MGSPTLLDDLEYESCEGPMTADLPIGALATLPEDVGALAPPGQEHQLAPEIDLAAIEHTMGSKRWDGINRNRKAWRGEFPSFQGCSSFATWCLWQGLDHFGVSDIVNGQRWEAGFTGIMLNHGQHVTRAELLRGDLLFYAANVTFLPSVLVCPPENPRRM